MNAPLFIDTLLFACFVAILAGFIVTSLGLNPDSFDIEFASMVADPFVSIAVVVVAVFSFRKFR